MRFSFASCILHGSYIYTIFELKGKSDAVKDEERWALERGSGTPGSGAANWDSINGLVPAFVTTQTANSSYILHHNVIHKTAMPDADAYLLFMRSPPLKQCALQLIPEQRQYRWKFGRADETEDDTSNRRMNDGEYSSFIAQLTAANII